MRLEPDRFDVDPADGLGDLGGEVRMIHYLLEAFAGPGAPFMWVITAVFAYALAVFVERTWMLSFSWRFDPQEVLAAIADDRADEAVASARRSPVAEVLRVGATAQDPDEAWDAMGAAAVAAEERILRRIPYLAAIGNVSTMLGLLGTVYGLILAFSALGDASAGERALRLTEGISTAMATTAYGLLVGIPALAAHAWLEARARSLIATMENAAGRLVARSRR